MILDLKRVEHLPMDVERDIQDILLENAFPVLESIGTAGLIRESSIYKSKIIRIVEQEYHVIGMTTSNVEGLTKQTLLAMKKDIKDAIVKRYNYLLEIKNQ